MQSEAVYQHFRSEEAPLIAEFSDLINQAESEYRPILTNFLDPRERVIIAALLPDNGLVKFKSWGGFKDAERQRGIFYPTYFKPRQDDFELTLLQLRYPIKFAQLKHSQILGTILGSGLQRQVIGDIITDDQQWQVVVDQKISQYLINQVDRIGRTKVKFETTLLSQVLSPAIDWQRAEISVLSWRLDTVLAMVFHFSRKKAKELLAADKVQLNWSRLNRPDTQLKLQDVLSVRGYGRVKLVSTTGVSKRGRIHLQVDILKK